MTGNDPARRRPTGAVFSRASSQVQPAQQIGFWPRFRQGRRDSGLRVASGLRCRRNQVSSAFTKVLCACPYPFGHALLTEHLFSLYRSRSLPEEVSSYAPLDETKQGVAMYNPVLPTAADLTATSDKAGSNDAPPPSPPARATRCGTCA